MERRAVVVGAGIAGLAAAHSLARLGYEVEVLERDRELRADGAGLTLWPNAVRALESLGLGDVAAESTAVVEEAVTLTPAGKTIARVPLDRIAARYGPLRSAHRAELLGALRARVDSAVRFGATVTAVDGGEVLADGESLRADLIVGADGVGSAVRAAVAPGIGPRSAGQTVWRGVAETGAATPVRASEAFGRGKRFGLVPLAGGRTYWFAVVTDGVGSVEAEFGDWHRPIADVLAATPESERSYLSVVDLPPLPRWHRDGIVLVGDAAHATTPNLGQGAAQALEDVAVLVTLLGSMPQADALRALERTRKRRAESVVRKSRAVGRIAQASNPLICMARDGLSRAAPAPLSFWQFRALLEPSAP